MIDTHTPYFLSFRIVGSISFFLLIVFFCVFFFFFFNDTATTEIYTLSLHDALPICHKAASDVRDEFVSVTEKLMDELAQCYNVLPQLDINNTIDHRPEGDEKWFLENEKTVTQFCRKLGEHIVALCQFKIGRAVQQEC